MKKYSSFLGLIIVFGLSLFAILPFFQQGFFQVHDNTQVARVFEMFQSLRDGLFPVRWVQDLGYGYGYPIFSFYAPFAYYLGALFMALGLGALDATKVMIALGLVAAGVSMYYLAREIFDDWTAILVSLLYVYAPYHALNTYVRGAVGELWAYAFIPIAFLGFWLTIKKPTWSTISLASVGYAAIIFSHNLTSLLITPFLIAEILYFLWRNSWIKKSIYASGIAFLLALMLSAWYWIPAVVEMGYTNVQSQAGGGSAYKDHFVCLTQLWNSQWGFGGSTAGCLDGMSFQLGKLHLLFALLGIASLPFISRKERSTLLFNFIAGLIAVFFMVSLSKPIWDLLPFMKYVQFPWRFAQPALFFLSLVGGYGLSLIIQSLSKITYGRAAKIILLSVVTLVTILFYQKLFKPQFIDSQYRDETSKKTVTWTISKISDEYLPKELKKPRSESQVPLSLYKEHDHIYVTVLNQSTNKVVLRTESQGEQELTLNLAYFPAWKLAIDGKYVETKAKNGLIVVAVPDGKHTIEAKFIQTPIEKAANIITVIGIVVLLIGIIKKRFIKL